MREFSLVSMTADIITLASMTADIINKSAQLLQGPN